MVTLSMIQFLVFAVEKFAASAINRALMQKGVSTAFAMIRGDPSRTTIWLASSIIRILIEHEAWLLSCSSLIPFVFHTFVRISLDHTASQHANLLKQEVELCTTLWNRRQADVAQLGREIVRVLSDAKDVSKI